MHHHITRICSAKNYMVWLLQKLTYWGSCQSEFHWTWWSKNVDHKGRSGSNGVLLGMTTWREVGVLLRSWEKSATESALLSPSPSAPFYSQCILIFSPNAQIRQPKLMDYSKKEGCEKENGWEKITCNILVSQELLWYTKIVSRDLVRKSKGICNRM